MTFNGISWGYVDSAQAAPYSYNAQGIIKMLNRCTAGGGNLLLNIGPAPDGSVPPEAVAPLTEVGKWLETNGAAVYGKMTSSGRRSYGGNGVCGCSVKGNSVYLWNWIWPSCGSMGIGGYMDAPKAVRFVHNGAPIDFEHKGHRILLKNLPAACPGPAAGITVIEMEFDKLPGYCFASYYPQLNAGREVTDQRI
jgi:alpha-L-fucosidase